MQRGRERQRGTERESESERERERERASERERERAREPERDRERQRETERGRERQRDDGDRQRASKLRAWGLLLGFKLKVSDFGFMDFSRPRALYVIFEPAMSCSLLAIHETPSIRRMINEAQSVSVIPVFQVLELWGM